MKLKQLRIMRGLTQAEFASMFGISQNTLSNYENEKREPSLDWLKMVSKKMNCPVDYLTDSDQICDGRMGAALTSEREFQGYSLQELSNETKIPLRDLQNYEEDIEPINYYLLSIICKLYDITVPTFYNRHEMWDEEIPEVFKGDVDAYLRFEKAREEDAIKERNKEKIIDAHTKLFPYYLDPETARLAQEAATDPDMRLLLDAKRDLSPEDMKVIIDMAKRLLDRK